MKKFKIIISLVLVLALLSTALLSFTGCSKKNNKPSVVIEKAFNKTMDAFSVGEGIFEYDDKSTYQATLTLDGSKISATSSETEGNMISDMVSDMMFVASGKWNAESLLVNLLLKNGDHEIVNGDIVYKDNQLAVDCEQIFGDTVLGTDFSKLKENLKESAVADFFGISLEGIEEMFSGAAVPNKLEGFEEKLPIIAEKALKDNYTLTKETEEIIVDGTTIKASIIKLQLTSENIINIIKTAINEIKADKELCNTINTLLNSQVPEGEDTDFISEIEKSLNEAYATIESKGVAVDARACMKDGYLVLADVVITAEGEMAKAALSFGADPSKASKVELRIEQQDQSLVIAWIVDNNTEEQYKAHLEIAISYDNNVVETKLRPIKIEYNKKSGEYSIAIDIPESVSVSLDGVYKEEKNAVLFSINKVVSKVTDDYSLESVTYNITLGLEGKIEKIENENIELPAYKEIFSLTEDELMELIMKISEGFGPGLFE